MKNTHWKTVLCLTFACLLLVGFNSSALAQRPDGSGGPGGDGSRLAGQITAFGTGSITLSTKDEKTETVLLSAETKYVRDRQAATLADFKVGDKVSVAGARNADGQLVAEHVVAGDRRGPGGGPKGKGPAGEFVSADLAAATVTIKKRDGESVTVYTTAATQIMRNREAAKLSDFQAGDHVAAVGKKDEAGRFVAERIFGGNEKPDAAHQARTVLFGELTDVDVEADTLTFTNQDGVVQTLRINHFTHVSRNNKSANLADFRTGDHVNVLGVTDESGQLIVTFVAAGTYRKAN